MHADPVALLPVTQADREAAAALYNLWGYCETVEALQSGGTHDGDDIVQAFARHRTPAPAGDVHLRTISRAIHEHLSRRDIMQYLDNEEDCEGLARSVIAALASTTTDSAVSGSAEVLREALDRIAFLSTNHGGWFESDPWKAYCELGDIARAALTEGQQS